MSLLDIDIYGEFANLGTDSRLLVPAAVRKRLPWLAGTKIIELFAALQDPGCVDLFPVLAFEDRLSRMREEIAMGHHAPLEALAALHDRYRRVSFYPSDNRVHLDQSITGRFQEAGTLFIEARGDHARVMTPALREARLATFFEVTSIG